MGFVTASRRIHTHMYTCMYTRIPCCRKTEGVDYQDYSKEALQQLLLKLKRKRHRPHLLYGSTDASTDLKMTLGANSLVTIDMMLP